MKRGIIIFCIVMTIFLISCSETNTLTENDSFENQGETNLVGQATQSNWVRVAECQKNGDYENSEFVKGALIFKKEKTSSWSKPYSDVCYNEGLIENYCRGGIAIKRSFIECEYGCKDGACSMEINEECPDGSCAECGNNIVEEFEACDGGDKCYGCKIKTHLLDSDANCNFNKKYPEWEKIVIQDASGKPLSDTLVHVYGYTSNDTSKMEENLGVLEENLILEAFTNEEGEVLMSDSVLDDLRGDFYNIVASKKGYLPTRLVHRACYLLNKPTILQLNPINDYIYDVNNLETLKPVWIDLFTQNINVLPFQAAGRPITFTYVPQVRSDLLVDTTSVDFTLKIAKQGVPKGTWSVEVTPDTINYKYQATSENVKLGQINSFEFVIDEIGIYYPYYTFKLNYKNGSTKEFTYYTPPGRAVPLLEKELGLGWEEEYVTPSDIKTPIISVFEPGNYDSFAEIIQGHNSNEKRINLVFLNVDFDTNNFKNILDYIISDGTYSFLNNQPFMDNKDNFNFWYYENPLTVDEATWPFTDTTKTILGKKPLTKSQEISLSHDFNGRTIFVVLVKDDTIVDIPTQASSGKCVFARGVSFGVSAKLLDSCLQGGTKEACFEELQLDRILNHELGHEVALLGEEYISDYSLFLLKEHIDEFGSHINPSYRSNIYFSSKLEPQDSCFQFKYAAYGFPLGAITCKADSIPDCQAPWADLIGNGCGEDGIIDCSIDDQKHFQEVGCYLGGGLGGSQAYPNLVKPTRTSIMSYRYDFLKVEEYGGRVYGPVNERAICRAIQTYTGSTTGICNELCLEGCAPGQKCVAGGCI